MGMEERRKHKTNRDVNNERAKKGLPYYVLTKHAIDRFEERFRGKFKDIDWEDEYTIKVKMMDMICEAAENNSFKNNHRFMDHIYNKYGYEENFKFLCNGMVTFVVVPKPERNNETIVTCFNGKHDCFVTQHKKFKKKENRQNNLDNINDVVALNLVDLDEVKSKGWNLGLSHAKQPN